MRVVINARSVSTGMTGIGFYAQSMVESLSRANREHELTVLCNPGAFSTINKNAAFRRKEVNVQGLLWEQFSLPMELSKLKADIYHSPLFVAPLVKSCKTMITIHDAIPIVCPEFSSKEFNKFFDDWCFRSANLADCVVTVSEASKRDLIQAGIPATKIKVVYQSVAESFKPQNQSQIESVRKKFSLNKPYLLFVGAVERRKNVKILLAALKLLREEMKHDLNLVIVGRELEADYQFSKAIETSGQQEHVRWLGYVTSEELPTLYSGADVFVFPSHYEGFGRPVLEAFSCGTPVVCSNTSSLPEVSGNCAALVSPDNSEEMAKAISKLFDNIDYRNNLVQNALKRAKLFTSERQGHSIMDLYTTLMEQQ